MAYFIIAHYVGGEFMISLPIEDPDEAQREADLVAEEARAMWDWWQDEDDISPMPTRTCSSEPMGAIELDGIEQVVVVQQVGDTRFITEENQWLG